MPDTQFESLMDDYVSKVMGVEHWILFQDAKDNKWKTASGNLDENTKYKLLIRARNNGSETYVKNVQIRVVNQTPARITYYKNATYAVAVDRLDSPVYPTELKPTDGVHAGDVTPTHVVPFMVKEGPDALTSIAHFGIYLEIVPQGHAWNTIFALLD